MPVPRHSQIKAGTLVSIVLKQDQRTGRQVQGAVANILTRGDHPRGVKVRLTDNRIGRVQKLVGPETVRLPASATMADHQNNPWASESQPHGASNTWQPSQPNPSNPSQQSQQSHGGSEGSYPQQRFYDGYNQQQYSQSNYSSSTQQDDSRYSSQPSYNAYQPPTSNSNPWSDAPSSNPPLPARHPNHNFSQMQSQHDSSFTPPQRRDTDDLLASQPDRAEQVEHLQAYEATANQSQEDRDRAQLEKEFPDVDGSLIAALYGDTKDLSATREMLQELGRQ